MKELKDLRGAGARTLEALQSAGITTVRGLLDELPRDYRDMTGPRALSALRPGENALVDVWVAGETRLKRGGRISIVSTVVTDGRDVAEAVWYNQPYLKKQLTEGKRLLLYGKTDLWKGRPRLVCPVFGQERGIVPLYRNIPGLRPASLRALMREALDAVPEIEDCLPQSVRERYGLQDKDSAVRTAHFPADMAQLALARRRLSFEELLLYQMCLMSQKDRGKKGVAIPCDREELSGIWDLFPFKPTGAQRKVLEEIASDLASERAMARLVQGDVGSGKTAVAFAAAALTARAGYQAALMAPTEVLARQHYESACRILGKAGVRVGLLTGSMTPAQHREAREKIAGGDWDLVVGTHALITENVRYRDLGLVITDEQHRFGVRQRTQLELKGDSTNVLVMSATPIPRSLALILYGDLDLSVVNELPPGKKPVTTRIVPESKRRGMYEFIKREIGLGRRCYIVCPLVEDSEAVEARSAEDVFEEAKKAFAPYRTELVHGRMRPADKERALGAFRSGEAQVLVSTTVIEVGVNVPEATVMVIEDAARFGLAQLHQLRGRVGRGSGEDVPDSWCFLMCESDERMRLMVSTNDGFAIAQKDMELRGPGELLGTRQTGLPAAGLGSAAGDLELLNETNAAAKELLRDGGEDARAVAQAAQERYGSRTGGVN